MAASAGRPSRSTPKAQKLFELVKRCGADLGQDDRLARHRRGLRRQQYRRLRRAGGRHDGRARRRDPFGSGISDRREPGRARAIVGADHHCGSPMGRHCELQGAAGAERGFPGDLRDGEADRRRLHQPARRQGHAGRQARPLRRRLRARARRSRRRPVRLRARECRDRRRSAAPARCSAGSASSSLSIPTGSAR